MANGHLVRVENVREHGRAPRVARVNDRLVIELALEGHVVVVRVERAQVRAQQLALEAVVPRVRGLHSLMDPQNRGDFMETIFNFLMIGLQFIIINGKAQEGSKENTLDLSNAGKNKGGEDQLSSYTLQLFLEKVPVPNGDEFTGILYEYENSEEINNELTRALQTDRDAAAASVPSFC